MPLLPDGVISSQLPHGGVINRQPALQHHLFQIPVAERIPEIPPHTQDNDDVFEMTPLEQGRSILSHSSQAIKPASKLFATDPKNVVERDRKRKMQTVDANR